MNNIRQRAHRKIDAANANIDASLAKLLELSESYREHHPELTEAFEHVAAGLVVAQEALTNLRAHI